MNLPTIQKHILPIAGSVKDALDRLNSLSGQQQILFVCQDDNILSGIVTDGDIRRALLKGVSLEGKVEDIMNRNYTSVDIHEDPTEKIVRGKQLRLKLIPVTDHGRINRMINLDAIEGYVPVDAVLMAGGRGERLRPLTIDTPKPLLPVGGMAIIDRNIEMLENYGIGRVHVTVNYLAEKIEEHFAARNSAEPRAVVECVREPKRLGTLGSLALVGNMTHPDVLVMNSDLLTKIELDKMWQHHRDTGAAVTVGAVPYTVSIPYAIMRTEGTRILALDEKPTYNYFANGGVYLIRKDIVERIPAGEYLDAPDYLEQLIAEGERVEYFPITGQWIDIGSPDDYRAANRLFGTII